MDIRIKALIWAAIIVGAAWLANAEGLSKGASFGITIGLASAAWGTIQSRNSCGRGCLQ